MEKDYGSVERTPGKYGQVEKNLPPGEIGDRERVGDTFELTQFCLDRTAEAVFWIEADARFVYVNEAACRSLKYSRQELLSMTVQSLGKFLSLEGMRVPSVRATTKLSGRPLSRCRFRLGAFSVGDFPDPGFACFRLAARATLL